MTGDGVNDAPALKKADAGIAVSGLTDAARAAADVVLLQPGLSVIIEAFEQARVIFGRMKSYAIFRISAAFGTRIIGTLVACYGVFMAPVGWTVTGLVWLYATAWFLFNDFVKVAAYRVLRHTRWLLGHEHPRSVAGA